MLLIIEADTGDMKDNVMRGKSIIDLILLMVMESTLCPASPFVSYNFMKNWTFHVVEIHIVKNIFW